VSAANSSIEEELDVPKAEASGASRVRSYGTSDAFEAGSCGVSAKDRLEVEASVAEHPRLPRRNLSLPGSRSRS